MKKKALAMILAVTVLLGGVIGGTLAWLIDSTDEVTNTFTVGDIDIDLAETTGNTYKMIPGNVLDKDPTVTVYGNSEDCWLFIKVVESGGASVTENGETHTYNFKSFLSYVMAEGWIELDSENYPGVYYQEVSESITNQEFAVLKDNQVTVNDTVTKQMMDALEEAIDSDENAYPKLTFTAYAVQKANIADAATAWTEANK